MIRRALLLLALAGIYVLVKRSKDASVSRENDRAADAQWTNEGGANS